MDESIVAKYMKRIRFHSALYHIFY